MGRLLAFHLKKSGASYTGTFETFLSGNPLNVTDIEVDRDGSIVFTTGGRATEGGIYRLRHKGGSTAPGRRGERGGIVEASADRVGLGSRDRGPRQIDGGTEVGNRAGGRRPVARPGRTTPRVDAAQSTRAQARSQITARRVGVEGRHGPRVCHAFARLSHGRASACGARAAVGRSRCHGPPAGLRGVCPQRN